ncbi:cytochrome P450 [Synechococcus sp. RSCCF101]|uniref:cytochrome P450 n=1 Tax=Synechococcus sp. RSCCF101 TaxID=2511069 RepID=UPI001783B781|nr:cytochrome P450 [Synechococcus sp. RSCCF101]
MVARPIPALELGARTQTLQVVLDPIGYYRRCFQAHDGAVRVRMSPTLPPQQVLINDPAILQELMGRDAGRGITAPGRLSGLLAQVVGEQSILLLEPRPHRARRKLLTPPFHGERLRAYGQTVIGLTRAAMADLSPGMRFDARERMQTITMGVILSAVFGLSEGQRHQRLRRLLGTSIEMRAGRIGSLLLFFPLLRRDVGPWSPGGRLRRISAEIEQLLLREIAERRKELEGTGQAEPRSDVLSLLLACRDEQGEGLSDAELHDELLTLLFAGHETTATALTWALYWLHRQPEVTATLRAELADNPGLDPDTLSRLPYLAAVVNEVLRIHPVAMLMLPRLVEEPLSLAGHAFEAGDVLIGCIQSVHERSDLYPEPLRFNPDRFLGRSVEPGGFLPFGGGVRRCIGASLALYEMKLVLATILSEHSLQLAPESDRAIAPRRRGFTLGPARPVRLVAT